MAYLNLEFYCFRLLRAFNLNWYLNRICFSATVYFSYRVQSVSLNKRIERLLEDRLWSLQWKACVIMVALLKAFKNGWRGVGWWRGLDDGRMERVGGWKDGESLNNGIMEKGWMMDEWREMLEDGRMEAWKDGEGLDDGRKREGSVLLNWLNYIISIYHYVIDWTVWFQYYYH